MLSVHCAIRHVAASRISLGRLMTSKRRPIPLPMMDCIGCKKVNTYLAFRKDSLSASVPNRARPSISRLFSRVVSQCVRGNAVAAREFPDNLHNKISDPTIYQEKHVCWTDSPPESRCSGV